jgi:hypothetical protein
MAASNGLASSGIDVFMMHHVQRAVHSHARSFSVLEEAME